MSDHLATIVCADGYRLQYRIWRIADAGRMARADVVLLNGVMSHSEWLRPLAEPLVEQGFKVVGADRRGSGGNNVARGDAPSSESLIDDVLRIIQAERTGGCPLFLVGWCWGAVLAINVASRVEGDLAGLALLAPGLHPAEQVRARIAKQGEAAQPGEPEARLETPISEEMFTQGPDLQSFILRDELRLRWFTARFHRVASELSIYAAARLRRLRVPILVVLAEADLATDNRETLRTLERVEKAPVKITWCQGAHGLQFEAPRELSRQLMSWMTESTRN